MGTILYKSRTTITAVFTAAFLYASLLLNGCGSDDAVRVNADDWTLETVASGNLVGSQSSLTTSADGTIHIAYHDSPEKKLIYTKRTSPGQWLHTWIDTIGWFGRSPVIEAGTGDTLHLAYQDMYHDDLRYARYDGQSWIIERIDPGISFGSSIVMLVRLDGIHMLDMNIQTSQVNYWRGSLSNWDWTGNIYLARAITSFDFSIGPNGPALVSILNPSNFSFLDNPLEASVLILRAAPDPGGPWNQTVITYIEGQPPSSPVLEFDGDGLLHILYQDQNKVLYDYNIGVIDSKAERGIICLEKGLTGDLWLLYTSGSNLSLRHYTPGEGWKIETTIYGCRPKGQYDLHIDHNGLVHASFYSSTSAELFYGRWDGSP